MNATWIRKLSLLVAAVLLVGVVSMGCKGKEEPAPKPTPELKEDTGGTEPAEKPKDEATKPEHPTSEHPKSDHPTSEHPK